MNICAQRNVHKENNRLTIDQEEPVMKKLAVPCLIVLLLFWGCVIRTEHKIEAHITLDIRHVATQAEDVLDFIEGKTDALPGLPEGGEPVSWWQRAVDVLNPIPVAHADTLQVTTSPLVQEIALRMRERHAAVEALKGKGCLGETNRGYLELRDCDTVREAEQRNEAQKLIADDNKDRKALYAEIARLNKEVSNLTVSTVESIYALQRLNRAKPGQWYQLPGPGEDFETVKKSDLGSKLAEQCKPDAWVMIP